MKKTLGKTDICLPVFIRCVYVISRRSRVDLKMKGDGREMLELFHLSPNCNFAVSPEVICVQSGGLEYSVQEHLEDHLECWTIEDELNNKFKIEYFLNCIFRRSWTCLVAFHGGTKFWAERTHQKRKNG